MRKYLLIICAMLLLSACSSEDILGSGTKGKVNNMKFGDTIKYNRTNTVTKATTKLAIKIDGYELVTEKSADDGSKDTYDYVKVFVQVENTGDENSNELSISHSSFNTYDVNGKEITKIAIYFDKLEDEFDPAELRPGGKNEGYIYIPYEEGATPAEIIFYDAVIKSRTDANQYVYKLE